MGKGLGKLQQRAIDKAADGITLISPWVLAADVFATDMPTDAQIRSARRALQGLAKKGLITDHGFSGGTGHKRYGGPHAARIQLEKSYVAAMREFTETSK